MRIFGNEKITKIIKISASSLQLNAGYKFHLGSSSYESGALILNTGTLGAGGMENLITPLTMYYVYAVVDSGVLKLIASQSVTKPSNFSLYKKVGAFYTDVSSNVFKVHFIGKVIKTTSGIFANGATQEIITDEDNVLTDITIIGTGLYDLNIPVGEFAVIPSVTIVNQDTNDSGAYTDRMIGTPSTTLIRMANWGSNAKIDNEFVHYVVTRKGVDAIQPDWNNY